MKKYLLLAIIILQTAFCFGQYGANKDCAQSGCGDKSQNIIRCWGVVRNFDQGIQIRVKGPIEDCSNSINNEPSRHSFRWHIEISGLMKLKQDCKLYVIGGDNRKSDFFIGNSDGGMLTDKITVDFLTFSNAETIGMEVRPISNRSTNPSTNSQPQNDLTEYNRSKAGLERQVNEKNTDIHKQNLENQRRAEEERQRKLKQQQQYNNSVKQANTSLGNKDYQGAIQNYGEAGKNATTKGEKNLAVAGVATSGALGILDGIQKQKEWNGERKRLKAEKVQNAISENEKRAEAEINTMTDPKIYETYCDFVIGNLEALGFHFTGISEILAFKNDSKYIKFNFNKGELEAVVRQAYFKGTMQNHISLITSNTMFRNLLLSSDLVAFLGSYNYWEDKTFDDWKRNSGNKIEYELSFSSLFRLEKSQQFIETYMSPYRTPNYAGISNIINSKEQKKAEFIPVKSEKTPANDVTVQFIIDKYINAIGGLEKLKTIKNVVTVTESKESKQKATFAYGKFISELTYKGIVYKTVFNGFTGYRESENKKSNLDDTSISIYKKGQPFSIFQLQQEPNLELGEMVVYKEKECYTIIEKGDVNTLNFVKKHFFDISSGLWIGTENLFTGTNYSSTDYDYYDDYREVGGILFPFIQQRCSEKDISTTRTIEIKLNEPLTDKDFE